MPDRPPTSTRSWLTRVAVAGPPLLLAVAGLAHPIDLSAATAEHWTTLHLILLPAFPLLGLGPWLAAPAASPWRLVTAILGYGYAIFYGALDTLAGIGAGTLLRQGHPDGVRDLLTIGNQLSFIGVAGYLLATLTSAIANVVTHRLRAVPGAVLVVAGSVSFLTSHIYWPRGGLTMIGLEVGWLLLLRLGRPRIA